MVSIDDVCKPVMVLTYGTFDLFHYGHVRLLQRARALGDGLVVFVSTPEFNEEKGKRAVIPLYDRMMIVGALECVTATDRESRWDQKLDDIKRYEDAGYRVIITMGDDWAIRPEFQGLPCEVICLPRTEGVSTKDIKDRVEDGSY